MRQPFHSLNISFTLSRYVAGLSGGALSLWTQPHATSSLPSRGSATGSNTARTYRGTTSGSTGGARRKMNSANGNLTARGSNENHGLEEAAAKWQSSAHVQSSTPVVHRGGVTALSFDPVSGRLLSGGKDGRLLLWVVAGTGSASDRGISPPASDQCYTPLLCLSHTCKDQCFIACCSN